MISDIKLQRLASGEPLPGLVLIQSQVVSSAVAAVDFTVGIDSLYDEYLFELSRVVPQSDSTLVYVNLSTNGGASFDTSAIYAVSDIHSTNGGAPAVAGSAAINRFILFGTTPGVGSDTGECLGASLTLHRPASTSLYKILQGTFSFVSSAGALCTGINGGAYKSVSAVNGVRFSMSASNITSGTFKMFGVRR